MNKAADKGYDIEMPSKAKQEFQAECNVNTIVELFMKGAPLPVQVHEGQFVDVSELGDYKTALETVMEAEQVFKTLPMAVKKRCENSVAGFLDFVNDPENKDEMIELGLLEPPADDPDGTKAFTRMADKRDAAKAKEAEVKAKKTEDPKKTKSE